MMTNPTKDVCEKGKKANVETDVLLTGKKKNRKGRDLTNKCECLQYTKKDLIQGAQRIYVWI